MYGTASDILRDPGMAILLAGLLAATALAGGPGGDPSGDDPVARLGPSLPPGTRSVVSVAFDRDGRLAASHIGGSTTIWDVDANTRLSQIPKAGEGLRFSPDGGCLGFLADGHLQVWSVEAGRPPRWLWGRGSGSPESFHFGADGTQAVAGGKGALVRRLSLEGGGLRGISPFWENDDWVFHPSPDGLFSATWGWPRYESIILFDTTRGRVACELSWRKEFGDPRLLYTPDSRAIVAVGKGAGGVVRVWETRSGELLSQFSREGSARKAVAVSEDGVLLAVVDHPRRVDIYHIWSGELRHAVVEQPVAVTSVAFSRDGGRLATGLADAVTTVWPLPDGLDSTDLWLESRPRGRAGADILALGDRDARKARAAMRRLEQEGDDAVAALRRLLGHGPPPDGDGVRRWIANLGAESFERREQATRRLRALGHRAEGPMLSALDAGVSPEQKLRLRELLRTLHDPFIGEQPEAMRRWRAIEVLERIGTPRAVEALVLVAEASPSQRERRAAAGALLRRGDRP